MASYTLIIFDFVMTDSINSSNYLGAIDTFGIFLKLNLSMGLRRWVDVTMEQEKFFKRNILCVSIIFIVQNCSVDLALQEIAKKLNKCKILSRRFVSLYKNTKFQSVKRWIFWNFLPCRWNSISESKHFVRPDVQVVLKPSLHN